VLHRSVSSIFSRLLKIRSQHAIPMFRALIIMRGAWRPETNFRGRGSNQPTQELFFPLFFLPLYFPFFPPLLQKRSKKRERSLSFPQFLMLRDPQEGYQLENRIYGRAKKWVKMRLFKNAFNVALTQGGKWDFLQV
jgi:hypothetical protein